MTIITKEEQDQFKKRLQTQVDSSDWEIAHEEADEILVEILLRLGYKDIVKIYDAIPKWYA